MAELRFSVNSLDTISTPFRYAFDKAKQLLSDDKNKKLELVIRDRKSKRTDPQNRRLWALYREVSENIYVEQTKQFSSEVWHEYFKGELIGFDEFVLPTGVVIKQPMSTTKLNVEEMTNYQMKIEQWCAEQGFPVFVDV